MLCLNGFELYSRWVPLLSGTTGEFIDVIGQVFAHRFILKKSPRELLMNRQPKLRFSVLRAKSLKQYYLKRRSVRKKPQTGFGPTFA